MVDVVFADWVMVDVVSADWVMVDVVFDISFIGGATFVDSVMEILVLEVRELGAVLNLLLLLIN